MVKYLQADILKASSAKEGNFPIDIVIHERVDSTNSWSLQQCKAGRRLPFACFAEEQTAGRGRRGKQWVMPAHSNIAMSLTWPFALSYRQLHLLPLSIAIAIVETLESLGLEEVQVKWPNDVYVRKKKIAGILIETQRVSNKQAEEGNDAGKCMAVVIGVGLNYDMSLLAQDKRLNLPDFADICNELDAQLVEDEASRANVAAMLLQYVTAACQNVQQDAKKYLEKFRKQYDFCKDKNVEIILDDNKALSGIALGVNDNAELRVLIDGRECVFNSAEVSVKPAVS